MREVNPFLSDSLFVGRRYELEQATQSLSYGQSILLIGGRRCGKTSVIRRVDACGRELIHLDAGGWRLDSEGAAVESIGEQARVAIKDRYQLEGFLKDRQPVTVVIDEAERLLRHEWAGSFLRFLRYLDGTSLRTQVAFALVGGPAFARYSNPEDHGSPPLNIAKPLWLRPLDYDARRELISQAPGAGHIADEIITIAGGHPWILTRLLAAIWDGCDLTAASEMLFESAIPHLDVWERQLGTDGAKLLAKLPVEGLPRTELEREHNKHLKEAIVATRSLCLVDEDETRTRLLPRPALFRDWLLGPQEVQEYDLAISYASENVAMARKIYERLDRKGGRGQFRVFFAPEEQGLWGQRLSDVLNGVYSVKSRYVLVLSSQAYVEKHWPRFELDVAVKSDVVRGRLLVVDLGKLPDNLPSDMIVKPSTQADLISLIDDITMKLTQTA
jgi:hypothetical protein